jgi:hypothetical protein
MGDHGSDRSPEVGVSFDRSGVVELDGGMGGLDHGLGRDQQRFQGRDREVAVTARGFVERIGVRLRERQRDAIGHGGGLVERLGTRGGWGATPSACLDSVD